MVFDNERYKGWTVITIKRHAAWQIHNFLPLVDSMYTKIRENFDKVGGQLLFDLSGLTYFYSTMVSLILRAVRLTGDAKNAVVITDEKTRDILTLLGIDKLVDMYESEAAFMAANQLA